MVVKGDATVWIRLERNWTVRVQSQCIVGTAGSWQVVGLCPALEVRLHDVALMVAPLTKP